MVLRATVRAEEVRTALSLRVPRRWEVRCAGARRSLPPPGMPEALKSSASAAGLSAPRTRAALALRGLSPCEGAQVVGLGRGAPRPRLLALDRLRLSVDRVPYGSQALASESLAAAPSPRGPRPLASYGPASRSQVAGLFLAPRAAGPRTALPGCPGSPRRSSRRPRPRGPCPSRQSGAGSPWTWVPVNHGTFL